MDPQRILLALATLFGAAGMYLLLPRAAARGRMTGVLLMAVSLGCGLSQFPTMGNWVADSVFLILAGVTVVSAIGAVTFRDPVYCAIWFGLTLLGTAGLFLFDGAQFLAVATIVVYAGAILVTFLFVLMLAQPAGRAAYDRTSWEALLAASAGAVLVGILTLTIAGVTTATAQQTAEASSAEDSTNEIGTTDNTPITTEALKANILADDHVAHLGKELFGRHLVAVEVVGTLLLAALVGAAVIVGQARGEAEG